MQWGSSYRMCISISRSGFSVEASAMAEFTDPCGSCAGNIIAEVSMAGGVDVSPVVVVITRSGETEGAVEASYRARPERGKT